MLSLTYQYDSGTNYHLTDIANGATLTVGGTSLESTFLVGGYIGGVPTTQTTAVIQGEGVLNVSQDGGIVTIANHRTVSVPAKADLDMSSLAEFRANLGTSGQFNVGSSQATATPGNVQLTLSTVRLANKNTITAGTLRVGSTIPDAVVSVGSVGYDPSNLYLGFDNTLNVDAIQVGRGYGSRVAGHLAFDASVLGGANAPEAVIRGSDGVSAVGSMKIGVNDGTAVNSTGQLGTVDFTGGEVDALITNLILGSGGRHSDRPEVFASGTLTMDRGKIVATNVIAGQTETTNSGGSILGGGPNQGIINVDGGEFQAGSMVLAQRTIESQEASGTLNVAGGAVTVTNGILMGNRIGGSSTNSLTATVNVTGGSLSVSDDITEGTAPTVISSTLNVNGGTLEMNGHNVSVDTFTAASGTLRNLGGLNSGGTLTKTTSGTLTVEGANSWTGETVVNAGTLLINGTHTGGDTYTVNSGGTLGGTGTITTTGNAGVILAAGGKLSPGNSPGTLTFDLGTGSLDLSAGIAAVSSQALTFELGTLSDSIALTGTMDIGSGLLEFDDFVFLDISGFAPGQYVLFDTDNAITGTLGSQLSGFVGGSEATLGFANGNQDLILTVVPEPSSVASVMLGLSLLSLLGRKRRI